MKVFVPGSLKTFLFYLLPIVLAICARLPVALAPAIRAETGDPLAGRFGGPFQLLSHDGRVVSDADFRGRFMLVYFGYTSCPDVCPIGLSAMTTALELLGTDAALVQPLFFTIDPDRDSAKVLGEYIKSFHPRFVALTGSEKQISALAKAYKVHRRKVPMPSVADPHDYVVDHGSFTYLMGPDGKFRTLIPHNTGPERIAAVVSSYLRAEVPATGGR